MVEVIVEAAKDVKARNIVSLDLRELGDAPADFFIICSAETTRKIKAISERVREFVFKEFRTKPLHVEGEGSNWVLMDYFNIVVHIFHPTAREFYELDELWGDAGITEYEED